MSQAFEIPNWLIYALIPIILLELGLFLFALQDLIRRKRTNGPKWVWVLVLLVQIIGPIIYLLVGRGEEDGDEDQ